MANLETINVFVNETKEATGTVIGVASDLLSGAIKILEKNPENEKQLALTLEYAYFFLKENLPKHKETDNGNKMPGPRYEHLYKYVSVCSMVSSFLSEENTNLFMGLLRSQGFCNE